MNPKDENLIDVDTSYLARPGQYEPGHGQPPSAFDPNASAPPPLGSTVMAAVVPGGGAPGGGAPADDFDAMFPPPPGAKGGGGGGGGGAAVPKAHVVDPPPGYSAQPGAPPPGYGGAPVVGAVVAGGQPDAGAPPDFDELEARFKAISGDGTTHFALHAPLPRVTTHCCAQAAAAAAARHQLHPLRCLRPRPRPPWLAVAPARRTTSRRGSLHSPVR